MPDPHTLTIAPHMPLHAGAWGDAVYALSEPYDPDAHMSFHPGDCLDLLRTIPDGAARLVVTSPPYNIGKSYEQRVPLDEYVAGQRAVIEEAVRVTADDGSICWQTGTHVGNGEIIPLDLLLFPIFRSLDLKMHGRIVWHYAHGLHARKRFSGRYETIMWFTKYADYHFNVDPVRVPQKYPGKRHHKGPRAGALSGNPLGKNPGDVWEIPNVKHNHVEKTGHPCQFPVDLVERLVLPMTEPGDLVVDPYMGVASTAVAALKHGRRAAGAEIEDEYYRIGVDRAEAAFHGTLRTRPMSRPIPQPSSVQTELPHSRPVTALPAH